jgi:hypothetical protein
MSGSLLILPDGSPAPPRSLYVFVGSFTLASDDGHDDRKGDRGKHQRDLRVDVYRRR